MSSARGFLDKTKIEFECPECGRRVSQSIGDGRRNRSIRCAGDHTIKVDGSARASRTARAPTKSIGRRAASS